MRRSALLILALTMAMAGPAFAQTDTGDAREGRRVAATWCANCHRISPTGPGPATDAAPAFAAVAAMPSTTDMALRAFLQSSHRNMPNFQLSGEQTDDLIAYILSLRQR